MDIEKEIEQIKKRQAYIENWIIKLGKEVKPVNSLMEKLIKLITKFETFDSLEKLLEEGLFNEEL